MLERTVPNVSALLADHHVQPAHLVARCLFLGGEHLRVRCRDLVDVRPDGEKLGVYIDENSDLIGEEGEALFTDAGEPTEFLQNRQQFLADLANSEMMTQRFVQQVVDLDLLDPIQIRLTYQSGQQRNVTGMLSINEKKVLELPEEKVTELHKSGFLGAMYAVMMSAGQLNRLVELSNGTDNPIRSMQLSVVKPEEAQAEAPSA